MIAAARAENVSPKFQWCLRHGAPIAAVDMAAFHRGHISEGTNILGEFLEDSWPALVESVLNLFREFWLRPRPAGMDEFHESWFA